MVTSVHPVEASRWIASFGGEDPVRHAGASRRFGGRTDWHAGASRRFGDRVVQR